jgi:hypothetical protein
MPFVHDHFLNHLDIDTHTEGLDRRVRDGRRGGRVDAVTWMWRVLETKSFDDVFMFKVLGLEIRSNKASRLKEALFTP